MSEDRPQRPTWPTIKLSAFLAGPLVQTAGMLAALGRHAFDLFRKEDTKRTPAKQASDSSCEASQWANLDLEVDVLDTAVPG